MDYQAAVQQTWRHWEPSLMRSDFRELVRYATLAASSHNTQPWRFEIGRDRIGIAPDFKRRCSAVDPDDHHLFASLGCAAENLVVAGLAAGLKAHVSVDAKMRGVDVILEPTAASRSSLFDAIVTRQCTRSEYDGKPLAVEQLRLLENAGRGEGVAVLLLTSDRQKDEVAQFVAQGNTRQFADAAWAEELKTWIRFNARDAIRWGDGLYGPVMGNPDVPPWLGETFLRLAFSSKTQNRKDSRNIKSSGAIAVIFSEKNDPQHWIEAGRCYERLALQAAALDLRTAFINQPVEVGDLRPQLARYLGIGERRPDLVVRVGHGPLAPRSLRRPLGDVVVDTTVRAVSRAQG
jgi:hypothetical protein